MNKTKRYFAVALVLACLGGCSGSSGLVPAKISGKISYKGQPLKGGKLQFVTPEGQGYSGVINTDGTYNASDLPIGELVVTVDTESLKPVVNTGKEATRRAGAMQPPPQDKTATKLEDVYVEIPKKYMKAGTSTITVVLVKGRQTKDIELTD